MVAQEGGRLNLLARSIVTYSISHLSQTDKVRFYYALKGRTGNGGIVHQSGIRQLAKTVLLVEPSQEGILLEFLNTWECPHSTMQAMINTHPPAPRKIQAPTTISWKTWRKKTKQGKKVHQAP